MTTPPSRSRRRGRVFRLLRWIMLVLVVLVLLPYVIAPFYRFIDPVSTAMLWRWMTGQRVERSVVRSTPCRRAAARGDRRRGRQLLQPSRHRLRGMREAIYEADDLTEARGGSTITQQVAKNLFLWHCAASCARRWNFRWRSGSTWSCPRRGCSRSISTSPNGARTGSSAPRPARAMPLASRRAHSRPREAALLAAILPNPIRAQRAKALDQRAPAGGHLRGPRRPRRGADGLRRRRPAARRRANPALASRPRHPL